MKTIFITCCAGLIFLAAFAARAQTLTFSNSIAVSGGNPASIVPFDIPQFSPSDGTLTSVALTLYFSSQSLFTYNGASASGTLTFFQTNSLSILYNGSDIVARDDYGSAIVNFGLPSTGYGSGSGPPLEANVVFSDATDLANFTGAGEVPLSGEYYDLPTVTWTSGYVTWTLDDTATLTALATYDFAPAPEPGVICIACLGALGFIVRKHRYWRKYEVSAGCAD